MERGGRQEYGMDGKRGNEMKKTGMYDSLVVIFARLKQIQIKGMSIIDRLMALGFGRCTSTCMHAYTDGGLSVYRIPPYTRVNCEMLKNLVSFEYHPGSSETGIPRPPIPIILTRTIVRVGVSVWQHSCYASNAAQSSPPEYVLAELL